jgi:ABC-type sugar transport system permease subunit
MQLSTSKPNMSNLRQRFTGSRGRKFREIISAYLFIAPATILIFIFGIFPVGFALFVSLHKWRLKRTGFIGLTNYVKAVDNLAYLALLVIGFGALVGVYLLIKGVTRQAVERQENPWPLLFPGALHAAAIVAFIRWIFLQMPEVLDIADKIKGVEKTQALFIQLLGEAFRAETVKPAWNLFLILLLAAWAISILALRFWRIRESSTYQAKLSLCWLGLVVGFGLLWITYSQISEIYAEALETGTDPGIISQIVTIASGVILLILAWKVWGSAAKQDTLRGFFVRILATMVLLVGGWLLIGEIPMVIAAGDKDIWKGLKVTIFFSMGTVPFQLAIALFLSVLLFQRLAGSNIFRIIYFLPYVTPAIASAAVFRQIFSTRESAPVNMLLKTFGLEPQMWLNEPEGVFAMLAHTLNVPLPDWAAGPSLALCVIILHSIWTYVGYDTVIYMAGLGNIPTELIDAAEVDGANKWHVFQHIIFPLLSPTTYFLSLIAIIGTFKAFNTIWMFRFNTLSLGTTDTFSVVIFLEFFDKLRYGYASALAFVLFAIILSLTFINNKVQGSRVFYG